MKNCLSCIALAIVSLPLPVAAQQPANPQSPTIRTNVDEVLLDLIVRDKKGKPVADLKPSDLTVLDNGAKQTLSGFRLVTGSEAIAAGGAKTPLDPLRQVRLVTLAFEAMTDASQRQLARRAALDLVQGNQETNVFYSVVVISTQLLVLRQFTTDESALTKAIEYATEGLGGPTMATESEAIQAELKRNLGPGVQDSDLLAAASDTANQTVSNGDQALQARLASVMLDMLRMDTAAANQGTDFTLSALRALVDGQRRMPGRKSIIYFTWGMYRGPELDVPFRTLLSAANRANITFYSIDTRGVMVSSQTAAARSQLAGAARASATTMTQTSGPVTKDQVMSSDNAEVSARSNVQEAIRDLAESTGGFLIADSNDLRLPLQHVNEEISSYYELSFNPGIQNYDGSFHKLAVNANRKDLVIHARNGYFALPAEVRGTGVQGFEVALLQMLSDGKLSDDVKFRAGGLQLQARPQGRSVLMLVEVPLHELQPVTDPAKKTQSVHCSLLALVKDAKGEVVEKLSRDRNFLVTADQLKGGNFQDKTTVTLPPGKYSLESVVADRNSSKAGIQRSEFSVPAAEKGVAISSLAMVRSYTPNTKAADANDPFVFENGIITPTLDRAIKKDPNAMLRLFFTVYRDAAIQAKPGVEIEFLQAGKSLQKAPLLLPDADPQGRIPYVMTIPASSIPPGDYEIRAIAHQGASTAEVTTPIRIEP